ncbi:hypothetical protein LOTGIDRAFT_192771, partial [Lottia gigantea]
MDTGNQDGYINSGFTSNETNGHVKSDSQYTEKESTGEADDQKIDIELAPIDPWELPELVDKSVKWRDLDGFGKVKRVLTLFIKFVILLCLLYLFICSLDFMSSAFTLVGGKAAGEALGNSELLQNPIAGLMLGVLVTVLVQSSSTSTSIVVSMVSSGILPVKFAIPIIFGTNIGTTVTNVIVSLGQVGHREQFRRAFAGATLHDFFNWFSVIVFLPLEIASGYLFHLTELIVSGISNDPDAENPEFLKAITSPFTSTIIELDKDIINAIAKGEELSDDDTILKRCCLKDTDYGYAFLNKTVTGEHLIISLVGMTTVTLEYIFTVANYHNLRDHLFVHTSLNDTEIGIIMLVVALLTLCICLLLIVKLLHSLMTGQIAKVIKKVMNSKFPGRLSFLTGYVAMMVGAGLTILVQSSSIFTSTMTPLVGVGVVSIENLFPLTVGSNLGTTATSVLAALAAPAAGFRDALQISFCHMFFNISGILVWYAIPPCRRIPIKTAKWMGETTEQYRWFAFVYLILAFLLFPVFVFGLSLGGWQVLVGVGTPLLLLIIFVIIVNILQAKKPSILPSKLQNWQFLPEPLRSLEPYDRIVV